jgi:hypothetical protein
VKIRLKGFPSWRNNQGFYPGGWLGNTLNQSLVSGLRRFKLQIKPVTSLIKKACNTFHLQAFLVFVSLLSKYKAMLNIRKKYIVDENNNKIAVQLDLDTFEKIEELLEQHSLKKELEEQKTDIKVDESSGVLNKFG